MNRRRGRFLTAGAAGAAFAFALTACAPGAGTTEEPSAETGSDEITTDIASLGDVTLTVWDQEVRGGQNEQIEQLNVRQV